MSEAEAREALVRVLAAQAVVLMKPETEMTVYDALVFLGRYWREVVVPAFAYLFSPLATKPPPLPQNMVTPPMWTTGQLQRMLPPMQGGLIKTPQKEGNGIEENSYVIRSEL